MQKRIGLAGFHCILGSQCRFRISVVPTGVWMLDEPVTRNRLQWSQNFIGTMLAMCLAKEASHIVLGGSKHVEDIRIKTALFEDGVISVKQAGSTHEL